VSVVIAGSAGDLQVRRVAEAIGERGGDALLLDTVRLPGHGRLSLLCGGETRLDGRTGRRPRSVYVRGLAWHPLAPCFTEDVETRPRGLIAQCDEKRAWLESLLLRLERGGARLVNGLEANEQHSRKPWQLDLLASRGLPVPSWLATNDPAEVRRFVKAVGRAVYKPLAGGATVREVQPADLEAERLEALSLAPVLFQQYVEGTPVRVYTVGGRAVAAATIASSAVDYRSDDATVTATRLTAGERRVAVGAARACGMAFAGVDLIRGAGGPVVLECNPSPMFAAFERHTGLDVAGPLAALLLR